MSDDVAFCFPGQGSQRQGMHGLYAGYPEVAEALKEVGEELREDLIAVCDDAEAINQTTNTQPLLLAIGVGVYRAWRNNGGKEPVLLAGHSLGEFSALVAAESMALADAARLVRVRAQAMQDAIPVGEGVMGAVLGIDAEKVEQACAQAGGEVWVANLNAPGQTVIAGLRGAFATASSLCKELGAKRVVELPVSIPSHCPLMQPAADSLAETLKDAKISDAKIPVIQNASNSNSCDAKEIKKNLVAQLVSPVKWIDCAKRLAASGKLVECGPAKILFNLNRRIVDADNCASLEDGAALARMLG